MSRVGSKEITIPDTVKVNMQDGIFMAEGPMGKLESPLNEDIEINIEENIIKMKPKSENKSLLPFWGLQRNIVNNIIVGVSEGFSKTLQMNGTGYRASISGTKLKLQLGYSHDIDYEIPKEIKVEVSKQTHWEISCSKNSTATLKQIDDSGELYNSNKEYLSNLK